MTKFIFVTSLYIASCTVILMIKPLPLNTAIGYCLLDPELWNMATLNHRVMELLNLELWNYGTVSYIGVNCGQDLT